MCNQRQGYSHIYHILQKMVMNLIIHFLDRFDDHLCKLFYGLRFARIIA